MESNGDKYMLALVLGEKTMSLVVHGPFNILWMWRLSQLITFVGNGGQMHVIMF